MEELHFVLGARGCKCFTKSNVALNDLFVSFIVELEEFAAGTVTIFNDAEQTEKSVLFLVLFSLVSRRPQPSSTESPPCVFWISVPVMIQISELGSHDV